MYTKQRFYLMDNLPRVLLLGFPFFQETGAILDARAGTFYIADFKETIPLCKIKKTLILNWYSLLLVSYNLAQKLPKLYIQFNYSFLKCLSSPTPMGLTEKKSFIFLKNLRRSKISLLQLHPDNAPLRWMMRSFVCSSSSIMMIRKKHTQKN